MADPSTKIEQATAPSRARNGRFMRKLGPQQDGWLIWSLKWQMWHRNSNGHACGYTNDIAEAGQFTREKAASYHDAESDEAWHISEKAHLIRREIQRAEQRLEALKARNPT